MAGGVWNGFLLGKVRSEAMPCRFCGGADGDGHFVGECAIGLQRNHEFHEVSTIDRSCPK